MYCDINNFYKLRLTTDGKTVLQNIFEHIFNGFS